MPALPRLHCPLFLLQAEIGESLDTLESLLSEAVPDKESRLMLTSAVYPAYDLAWQMAPWGECTVLHTTGSKT
jgi:hypothetical protein